MGMPVSLEITGDIDESLFKKIFDYFRVVDEKFSTYKETSEISAINRGELKPEQYSSEMKEVFRLSEETKKLTYGYFDIWHNGKCDPSGLVKGWAIWNAAKMLKDSGVKNYYLDVGGDIQVGGVNSEGKTWSVGIKNPFNQKEIVKVIYAKDGTGIATSGTYIRGDHIYNPKSDEKITDVVSLTVIGPNVYEADRFATAAFAMGAKGIEFIEKLGGFEGYMIDKKGTATFTSGFDKYTRPHD